MSLKKIFREGYHVTREEGLRHAYLRGKGFTREATFRAWHKASGRVNRGVPIYEKDWDLLIILDACRFDSLQNISNDYGFVGEVDSIESVGSYSRSWMENNFISSYRDEISQTVMVSGNPYTESVLDTEQFKQLEEVWRYSWDSDVGTIRPRPITDSAISIARKTDVEQMIVHYMQPHAPFTTNPNLESGLSPSNWGDTIDRSIWTRVRDGSVPLAKAKKAYVEELKMVLEEVELLLNNIDAETAVISADHGEAMGEYGIYGHPRGVAIDALRVVPWAKTTATDNMSHEPKPSSEPSRTEGDQMDRLRDLGYLG